MPRQGNRREDIVRGGFSTPLDAPTIPRFPFSFRDVDVLTLCYRTDREAVAALLPEPLVPTGDAVMIHLYRMNDTDWLGPYREANVMVGAALPGGEAGAYSPYLFLSSEVGVAHGREIHGQPKKLAEPSIEMRGDLIVGRIVRNGIDIVTGSVAQIV
ncbi:acetoacetate decarboxylase family protein, partial [Rubellimicrobium sp. CFH 75288]|uniref:acetoacetate decarboxylase family protein n=1 Tax=Rubellimicrobium sp. CFH 75288 TaxID=2697034 RepID=UPI001412B1DE